MVMRHIVTVNVRAMIDFELLHVITLSKISMFIKHKNFVYEKGGDML